MITDARNVINVPVVMPCNICCRPKKSSIAIATAPRASISGDEIDCTATDFMFAVSSRLGRAAKALHLPQLHAKRFDDAVAGDGLVDDVLNLCQLVLPTARPSPTLAADPACRQIRSQGQTAAAPTPCCRPRKCTTPIMKSSVKSCCKKSLMTVAIACLHAIHVVDSVEVSVPVA